MKKSKIKINVSKNPSEGAGKELSRLFSLNDGKPVLFVIAGGSAFKVLDHISDECFSPLMTVVMSDERVSTELDENNFTSLQATHFYNKLVSHDVYCIPTELHEGESSKELQARYDDGLKKWKSDFPKGIVIGLYGIGTDGHTAGLIPGTYSPKEFLKRYDSENLAEEMDAKDKNPFRHRITTTFKFLRKYVDHAVFFAEGENKKEVLKKVLSEKGDICETPVRIMHEMKNVQVFTDVNI